MSFDETLVKTFFSFSLNTVLAASMACNSKLYINILASNLTSLYSKKQPHSSLQFMTPAAFAVQVA